MGGSSSQVIGYKYYAGLQVALGNPIEKVLNINPDNRGWINSPAQLEILDQGDTSIFFNEPDLFGGDNGEGGWYGFIDIHTGRPEFVRQNEYLAANESEIVSAFPNLSYLVYRGITNDKGFHLVSMSGMLKEVLYWVKRINVKNDGSEQWNLSKAEIPSLIKQPQISNVLDNYYASFSMTAVDDNTKSTSGSINVDDWSPSVALQYPVLNGQLLDSGYTWVNQDDPDKFYGTVTGSCTATFSVNAHHKVQVVFHTDGGEDFPYAPIFNVVSDGSIISNEYIKEYSGPITSHTHNIDFNGSEISISIAVAPHLISTSTQSNRLFPLNFTVYYSDYKSAVYEDGTDINPIHKIREILTDFTAMNKPESDINEESFIAAAERIFDEGLGISWAIQEKSCKEAIDELLFHIEAGIRVNRQTGLYEIVLFRDDLIDLDNAITFSNSNIKSFQPEISTSDDLINVLNVKYYDRINIKDGAFSVYENGNIRSTDQEISEEVNFTYFMNLRNAELVANWKLKQLSTPAWKGTFTTGIYEARKINRYDVVKLSWPDIGIYELPVRVMKISLGDGKTNEVSIDFIEVIPYSSIDYQTINVDDKPTEVVAPLQNVSVAFEAPYYEVVQLVGQTQLDIELTNNPDLGYLFVSTRKPQNNSLNALLYVDDGMGYVKEGVVNYCPFAQLDQDIDYLDSSFSIKNIQSISSVQIGSAMLVGNEIMVFQSYDISTNIITVKRGALDTLPSKHKSNDMVFFYDAYPAYSQTQYVISELVNAKVLTTTPSAVLDIDSAVANSVEFNARMIRPYPPANIKINDTYFIESIIVSNDVVVTWVDRNRVQQTGGVILGWTDATVSKEIGVTYSIELSSEGVVLASDSGINANTYTFASTLLIPNKPHKLKLWSVRDGYESYQIFEHNFFGEAISLILTATVYDDEVIGSTVPDANIDVDVDESLTANMVFDGSSISGTAEPGATITIEIEE